MEYLDLLLDLAHIDGTLRILTPQVSGYFAPEQTLPLEGPTGILRVGKYKPPGTPFTTSFKWMDGNGAFHPFFIMHDLESSSN